jgi:hypothetical protein
VKANANSIIQWPAITGSPWGTLTTCIVSDVWHARKPGCYGSWNAAVHSRERYYDH